MDYRLLDQATERNRVPPPQTRAELRDVRTREDSRRTPALDSIASRVEAMLERAGASRDQVADAFMTCGILGVRNAVRMLNPVVRFVQKSVEPNVLLNLMNPRSLRMIFPDGTVAQANVPQAVYEFLEAFNEGRYPQLELPYPGTTDGAPVLQSTSK